MVARPEGDSVDVSLALPFKLSRPRFYAYRGMGFINCITGAASSWKHTKLCSTVASSFSLSFPFSRAALRRVLERSARSVWWCDPFDDAACGCKLELDAAWFPSKSIEFRPPWTSNVYNNQPKLCVPASRRRRSRCRAYSQCVEERNDFSLRLLGYLYYNYCGVSICGDFPIPSPL